MSDMGRDLPPSQHLLLPTEDGFPDLKRLGDPGRVTVLPPFEEPKHKPDGPWLRTLRTICYITVIVTCVALTIVLFDAYVLIDNIRELVTAWENEITSPGMLGN